MDEKTKLTVRVDRQWLKAAKKYAKRNNTSLSRLISLYLRSLAVEDEPLVSTPILRRVSGILPADVSREEHTAHIEKKYGR